MTGVVNQTGARSGIVGTNVGTPESDNASALTSGTLPIARMAAGTVVQVTFVKSADDGSDAGSGTGQVLACAGTITPSSGTNKILAVGMVHMQIANNDAGDAYYGGINMITSGTIGNAQTVRFGQYNGTGYYGIKIYVEGWTDALRMTQMYHVQTLFDPQTTNEVTVSLNGHGYNTNNGTVSVNENAGSTPYGQHSALTLMEIKV